MLISPREAAYRRSQRPASAEESPGGLLASGILSVPVTSASRAATNEFREPMTLSSRSWIVGSHRISDPATSVCFPLIQVRLSAYCLLLS